MEAAKARLAKGQQFQNWDQFRHDVITLGVLVKKVIFPKWKNKARAVYVCRVGDVCRTVSAGREEVERLWAEFRDVDVDMEIPVDKDVVDREAMDCVPDSQVALVPAGASSALPNQVPPNHAVLICPPLFKVGVPTSQVRTLLFTTMPTCNVPFT